MRNGINNLTLCNPHPSGHARTPGSPAQSRASRVLRQHRSTAEDRTSNHVRHQSQSHLDLKTSLTDLHSSSSITLGFTWMTSKKNETVRAFLKKFSGSTLFLFPHKIGLDGSCYSLHKCCTCLQFMKWEQLSNSEHCETVRDVWDIWEGISSLFFFTPLFYIQNIPITLRESTGLITEAANN